MLFFIDLTAFSCIYSAKNDIITHMKQSTNIPEKLLSPYSPASTEDKIYEKWEKSGLFNPDVCERSEIIDDSAPSYSIVLPPPNVTGVLHLGHATTVSIQDVLIRYHRMRGFRTLWVPGTDHAAIATQSKVEKDISKNEKKSRHDLGRDELLRRVDQFAQNSHDTIVTQVRRLGASLDWSREAFTLDDTRSYAVRTAFKNMYDAGLIYRGNRIVNWDPKGQTTISDDEIVHEERSANLYTFRYSSEFPIAISTTRPETKLGDVAVAVHPDDERYKKYIGKVYDVVFCGENLQIRVIADKEVDLNFGTGALGVTPAHSAVDWEIGERHGLPHIQVINEYAKMIVGDATIKGRKTVEAREAIVAWLRQNSLLEKEETVTQNVATAERTGAVIEPLPKLQWFVNVNKQFSLPYSNIEGIKSGKTTTLKEIMRHVVSSGQIEIIPGYFDKTYYHWIDNLRDWCISRQIWYGHQIPVWYREDKIYCGVEPPAGDGWTQDEDTLDTWFSSGLWTLSTLGWPNKTKDLELYHPTSVLETGYDILFFWVSRMILMTGFNAGEVPFKRVYLHGLVRDNKGRKMSKSLSNGIDPIKVADKYGADAVRMSLMVGAAPGTDMRMSDDKIKGYKHFCNKLWNISRFVLTITDGIEYYAGFSEWTDNDVKHIQQRDSEIQRLTEDLDAMRIHIAADRMYQYAWKVFADQIIEESKEIIGVFGKAGVGTDKEALSRSQFLLHTLRVLLITLHPFVPYVTEELWAMFPQYSSSKGKLLMVEGWPATER